jgi:arsenite methyltransferase
MTAADRLTAAGVDVDAVLRYTALAKRAVAEGLIGYVLLIAENHELSAVAAGERGAA